MKITIRNRVKIDQQEELIKETYNAKIKQSAQHTLIMYKNGENEKVLLKINEAEVTMTRYSTQAVKMRFNPEIPSHTTYKGVGKLSIFTHQLDLNPSKGQLKIKYQLSQGEMSIGEYHLRIDWSEVPDVKEEES